MKTARVYRYVLPIADDPVIRMPKGATVRSVAAGRYDDGSLELWAEVDPEAKEVSRQFHVHGTGHDLNPERKSFIGTVQTHGGALVWHIYEGIEES